MQLEVLKKTLKFSVEQNNLQISEIISQKVEAEIEKIKVLSAAMIQKVVTDPNEDILFSGIATRRGNNIVITKSSYNTYLMKKSKTDMVSINKIHIAYKSDLIKTFERGHRCSKYIQRIEFPCNMPLTAIDTIKIRSS